ncbi:TetR/AcrR family transcriptional regulator [Devosia sp. UYZn731]|uniref:TetR/AcrR family transcriptional regulator n=1 Tax=Devosia sp. UYZn731 TaxID=3156345 RepID=UPI00339655E5
MLDKRERILAAAARLIVDNGLKCSMSAIAEEANVATGSLYNYFASKEDLVRGVYGRVAEVMTERVVVEHHAETAHRDRVRHYIAQYIDFIWEDPQRARLFDYLTNNPLVTLSEAQDIFGAFSKHSVDMLAAAQEAGVVRAGPPALMSSFVRGAIRNTLKHRRFNPKPMALAEREHLTAMCWDSIAANGS